MALHYRMWKFLNPEREGDRVCVSFSLGVQNIQTYLSIRPSSSFASMISGIPAISVNTVRMVIQIIENIMVPFSWLCPIIIECGKIAIVKEEETVYWNIVSSELMIKC